MSMRFLYLPQVNLQVIHFICRILCTCVKSVFSAKDGLSLEGPMKDDMQCSTIRRRVGLTSASEPDITSNFSQMAPIDMVKPWQP